MALRAAKGLFRAAAPAAPRTAARRPMSVWSPLVNKPYEIPKTQSTFKTTEKPTYLKGSTDAIVTAAGLGGLSLVFIRTMSGFIDMSLGQNKVDIQ